MNSFRDIYLQKVRNIQEDDYLYENDNHLERLFNNQDLKYRRGDADYEGPDKVKFKPMHTLYSHLDERGLHAFTGQHLGAHSHTKFDYSDSSSGSDILRRVRQQNPHLHAGLHEAIAKAIKNHIDTHHGGQFEAG